MYVICGNRDDVAEVKQQTLRHHQSHTLKINNVFGHITLKIPLYKNKTQFFTINSCIHPRTLTRSKKYIQNTTKIKTKTN